MNAWNISQVQKNNNFLVNLELKFELMRHLIDPSEQRNLTLKVIQGLVIIIFSQFFLVSGDKLVYCHLVPDTESNNNNTTIDNNVIDLIHKNSSTNITVIYLKHIDG